MNKEQVGKGSILGALVGDAAGATLEFLSRTPDRSQVKQAMAMVGGGCWRTAPGQITDDGEMAMCLMHALAGEESFSIERVAQNYLLWYQSIPFDIGRTTSTGLSGGLKQPEGLIHRGMRNPNPTCQHSSAVYCLAIRHLMVNPNDSEGAFQTAEEWARTLGNREVQEWLSLAERNEDVGYSPSIGFVRYGFVHAFRHLQNKTLYIDAIFETLSGGGDTDTNACIVGGLVGAYHGEEGIPEPMREAILRCDTQKGRSRPEFLQTRVQFPTLLDRLIG